MTDFYEMALVEDVLVVFVVGPMSEIRHFTYTGPDESLVESARYRRSR